MFVPILNHVKTMVHVPPWATIVTAAIALKLGWESTAQFLVGSLQLASCFYTNFIV